MHRQDLLQHLADYRTRWPRETAVIDRYVDFVKSHPDCFERSLSVGHVTGSAWVVNAAGTHVLLTHHRKLNQWFQLGGHADGEADVQAVARREAEEESGLQNLKAIGPGIFDVDIHTIPARKSDPEHEHYDVRFVFQACGDETYAVSDESHDLAWVKLSGITHYTKEASMLRMADKWLNREENGFF